MKRADDFLINRRGEIVSRSDGTAHPQRKSGEEQFVAPEQQIITSLLELRRFRVIHQILVSELGAAESRYAISRGAEKVRHGYLHPGHRGDMIVIKRK